MSTTTGHWRPFTEYLLAQAAERPPPSAEEKAADEAYWRGWEATHTEVPTT